MKFCGTIGKMFVGQLGIVLIVINLFLKSVADTFNTEDQSIFLTSCGISPGTGFLLYKNIFSSHIRELRNAYKKRCSKRLCSAPTTLCYHSGQNCKTERFISSPQVTTIFLNTGIVLPVGTGLCAKCRKSLLKQAQCEGFSSDVSQIVQGGQLSYLRQESLVSDHEMTDDVPEFSSKTTVESQPDHAKECLDELVLSQETYQSLAGSQVSEASVCVMEKIDKLNEFISLSGISPVKKIQGPLESARARTIQRYKLKARQCLNSVFETIQFVQVRHHF